MDDHYTCKDPFEKTKHGSICENELLHNMVPALPCTLPNPQVYESVQFVGFEPKYVMTKFSAAAALWCPNRRDVREPLAETEALETRQYYATI